jgi:hypothetical protein
VRGCDDLEPAWVDLDKLDAIATLDLKGLAEVRRDRDLPLAGVGGAGSW